MSVDRASLVIAAVAAGERWAVRTSDRAGRLVGILMASLMPILLPDRVALVGGTVLMGGAVHRVRAGECGRRRRCGIRQRARDRRGAVHGNRRGRGGSGPGVPDEDPDIEPVRGSSVSRRSTTGVR